MSFVADGNEEFEKKCLLCLIMGDTAVLAVSPMIRESKH